MVTDQGWLAHQGWIPYQTGQSVYNEVITRPACQSTMAIIFNIRPASWSTMDLLMDQPVCLQWV
jgi:hypothetical protein